LLLVLFVALWEYLVKSEIIPAIIVPPASEVATALFAFLTSNWSFFHGHLLETLYATVLGFSLGSALGFILGVLLGASRFVRAVFSSYVVGFYTLPKVALAPVFVTWFGFGLTSKVVMSVVICFFPVFVNTLTGFGLVDERALQLMRSLGASRMEILRKLDLPTALPNIFAGLKTAMTLALVGVIVGELVGTSQGLGHLIGLYSFQLQVDNVFAIIVLLGIMGWGLYSIVDVIGRKAVFWHDT
jgi:NitT/TauT family transport system permease protein